MRPYLFREARKFVAELNTALCEQMTVNHHKILEQFVDFKDRTIRRIEYNDHLKDVTMQLEKRLALQSPAFEGEYAIDERTTLSLYDSLIPKLKEHRRFKIKADDAFSINDFKVQQRLRELELKLH